jgi:hypothetical protein
MEDGKHIHDKSRLMDPATGVLTSEEEENTSFQPHQADQTTYKQESVELVYLTLGTTVG